MPVSAKRTARAKSASTERKAQAKAVPTKTRKPAAKAKVAHNKATLKSRPEKAAPEKAAKLKTTKQATAKTAADKSRPGRSATATKPARQPAPPRTAAKGAARPAAIAQGKAVQSKTAPARRTQTRTSQAKATQAQTTQAHTTQGKMAQSKASEGRAAPAGRAQARAAQPSPVETRSPQAKSAPAKPAQPKSAPKAAASSSTPADLARDDNKIMIKTKNEKVQTKQDESDVEYAAGDYVVYPTHGVGRVIGVEAQEISGFQLRLIAIKFEKDRMTLRVPVAKAQESGLRKLSTRKVMDSALAALKGKSRVKRTMWSRRAQEYEAKINSGDPVSIAEVVRDLHRGSDQPDQSYSERQMYQAALDRLAREFAAVEKIDEATAAERLEQLLKAA